MTSRRTRRALLLLCGLIAQLALLAIALSGASGSSGQRLVSSPLVAVPEGSTPLSAESGQPVAQEYAIRWSSKAMLIAVTMRLDWPADAGVLSAGELPNGGWLIYTFSDGNQTQSIYLDRGTGIYLASAESEFGGSNWPRLDLTTYPRSSTIATATADITNGFAYRAACPETRTTALVTATRVKNDGGSSTPVWTVTYGDSGYGGTYDVLVQLDAQSGNVIKNEVRDRGCD